MMQITYEQKAPAYANVDNIKEKFEKHYGRIHTEVSDFLKVIKEEETLEPQGTWLKDLTLSNGKQSMLYRVCLDDESFHEQSYYIQSLLPFFIDGASVIEPCPYW